MQPTERNYDEVSIMRGVLALLVILGHILTQLDETKYGYEFAYLLGKVIYGFHMPAFFVVSGFVSVKILGLTVIGDKAEFIKEKFRRLMVPYFVMGVLYLPARILLAKIARNHYSISQFPRIFIGENPDGAMWFLYVLFVVTVIACMIVSKERIYPLLMVVFGLYLATLFMEVAPELLLKIMTYLFFYILGIVIRLRYEELKEDIIRYWWYIFFGCLAVFIAGNILWIAFDISQAHILTSFSGIAILWVVALTISRNKDGVLFRYCFLLGDYSMDLYVFGEPIKVVMRMVFGFLPLLLMVPLTLLATIVVSMFVSWLIVRRVKIFRVLLLGRNG